MRCVSVQPIALGMGLNIQTYKLWKDRAMLELNVAVLHSFQVKQHLHVHTLYSRICECFDEIAIVVRFLGVPEVHVHISFHV